ncbi:MAG: efflux transporter outer membrane subunit [Pseudomonadota bacterium]|nr:efflux transporter outer membrane subunit [Pseudomonadota bacterium]
MKQTLLAAASLSLAACAGVTPPVAEITPLPASFEYVDASIRGAVPEKEWWRAFGDASLDALIAEALEANQDLAAGVARVKQSRASLKSVNSSLFPSIGASASGSSDSEGGYGDFSTSGRLSASYQLDLFGQNRAARTGARASYEAARFNQRALELTVESDVAFTYFSIIALRERLQVARDNLEISERIYEIVSVRYKAGDVSGFDMASQEASIANARARIPSLEQQLVSLETALAVLLGRVPEGYRAPAGDALALTPPSIDIGLPSDLLLRRPDLLAAEAGLEGADADVAAARAAFFPSVDLSAGLAASALSGGANLVGSLAGSASQTIFSGGRLIAGLEGAKAGAEEQVARYRQTTLNALREVETGLVSLDTAERREAQLTIARDASKRSLDLAEIRYRSGADDLTSLLNAQATFFNASDSLVQARLDRLSAATDLFVAVGGGWDGES